MDSRDTDTTKHLNFIHSVVFLQWNYRKRLWRDTLFSRRLLSNVSFIFVTYIPTVKKHSETNLQRNKTYWAFEQHLHRSSLDAPDPTAYCRTCLLSITCPSIVSMLGSKPCVGAAVWEHRREVPLFSQIIADQSGEVYEHTLTHHLSSFACGHYLSSQQLVASPPSSPLMRFSLSPLPNLLSTFLPLLLSYNHCISPSTCFELETVIEHSSRTQKQPEQSAHLPAKHLTLSNLPTWKHHDCIKTRQP